MPPASSNSGRISGEELLELLLQERRERESANALIAEWMEQQRRLYSEQMAQHMQFMQGFFDVHSRTLQGLAGRSTQGAPEQPEAALSPPMSPSVDRRPVKASQPPGDRANAPAPPASTWAAHYPERPGSGRPGPPAASAVRASGGAEPPPPAGSRGESGGEADLEHLSKGDELLNWWRRTSGMQTVEKWVSNYKKHPAGWGALLMIHGIPEVTGRLRSKVENYAIYSALFLSMSIALLTEPPESMTTWEDSLPRLEWWWNQVRMRIYLYCFAIGTAAHMLSILLAMGFVNALNEAARDSDVYRMFSRGQGFRATVKCQVAFRVGCVADFIAVVAAVSRYIGYEALGGTVLMLLVCGWIFRSTTSRLFSSASIVRYWREELGGRPDREDPYDLEAPIGFFRDLAEANRRYFSPEALAAGADVSYAALTGRGGPEQRQGPDQHGHHPPRAAAVAAFF